MRPPRRRSPRWPLTSLPLSLGRRSRLVRGPSALAVMERSSSLPWALTHSSMFLMRHSPESFPHAVPRSRGISPWREPAAGLNSLMRSLMSRSRQHSPLWRSTSSTPSQDRLDRSTRSAPGRHSPPDAQALVVRIGHRRRPLGGEGRYHTHEHLFVVRYVSAVHRACSRVETPPP